MTKHLTQTFKNLSVTACGQKNRALDAIYLKLIMGYNWLVKIFKSPIVQLSTPLEKSLAPTMLPEFGKDIVWLSPMPLVKPPKPTRRTRIRVSAVRNRHKNSLVVLKSRRAPIFAWDGFPLGTLKGRKARS